MITALLFIVILSLLVLIHEFGHFWVAKKLGIKVEEFGFGFPPKVISIQIGETVYSINALPIGGFVKLYGEDEAGAGRVSTQNSKPITKNLDRAFFARPAWQRALVVVAGVVMNFLLAVVIISYLFTQGTPVPLGKVIIDTVLPGSAAEKASLRKGDVILSINNKEVKTVVELQRIVQPLLEKQVFLVFERENTRQRVAVVTQRKIVNNKTIGVIGVELHDYVIKKYSWYEAPFAGLYETTISSVKAVVQLPSTMAKLLSDLASGREPAGIAGPIGIAGATGDIVKRGGILAVIPLVGFLSLNLAILNILPIPALDGGRLFFILIELVVRRKVSQKFEQMAHTIGMVFLLTLIIVITYYDILKALSGKTMFTP